MQNRVDALLEEEQTLIKKWDEQDIESARETALEILPLLRLETRENKDGGQNTPPLLRLIDTIKTNGTPNNSRNRDNHGAAVRRKFHVIENNVEEKTTKPTTTRKLGSRINSRVFGMGRSLGLPGGRDSTTTPTANARNGENTANVATEQAVEPAPLRSLSVARDGLPRGLGTWVPFERRYRGEGMLERRLGSRPHACTTGSAPNAGVGAGKLPEQSHDDCRPTPLLQQVLRLEYGSGVSTTTIVRMVLEQRSAPHCDCEYSLPPGVVIQAAHDRNSNEERCEVRGVVRVEAYLPVSSKTLTVRVRVQPVTTKNVAVAKGTSNPVDDPTPVLPIKVSTAACVKGGAAATTERSTSEEEEKFLQVAEARYKDECRSRKQRRRALREAREAEARRHTAESIAVVQETSTGTSSCSSQAGQQQGEPSTTVAAGNQYQGHVFDDVADDGQKKQNHAFSMLLVRANAVVPIRLVHIGSGSWREAIGELVGCPRGQELRTVRESMRLSCSAQQQGLQKNVLEPLTLGLTGVGLKTTLLPCRLVVSFPHGVTAASSCFIQNQASKIMTHNLPCPEYCCRHSSERGPSVSIYYSAR